MEGIFRIWSLQKKKRSGGELQDDWSFQTWQLWEEFGARNLLNGRNHTRRWRKHLFSTGRRRNHHGAACTLHAVEAMTLEKPICEWIESSCLE